MPALPKGHETHHHALMLDIFCDTACNLHCTRQHIYLLCFSSPYPLSLIANVRMEHRGDIKRARQITNALFDELGAECADVAALEKLGELMFDPDDKGQDKLNEIYHKVISMPERVKSVKALSDALKNLIGLERQAYDIDGPEGDNSVKQLSDLMDSLSQGA